MDLEDLTLGLIELRDRMRDVVTVLDALIDRGAGPYEIEVARERSEAWARLRAWKAKQS